MTVESRGKDTYALTGGTPTTDTFATLVTALRASSLGAMGVDCTNARGVDCVASVDFAKTIVSGTLKAFCYMACDINADRSIPPAARRWVRCPALDVVLVGGSVERDEPTGDLETPVGSYRLAYVPDAVVGSSGSTTLQLTYTVRRWGN